MKYLVILMILFPVVICAGENSIPTDTRAGVYALEYRAGISKYFAYCNDVGGECKEDCSPEEFSISKLPDAEPGTDVYLYCGKCEPGECTNEQLIKSDNGAKCCIPKTKNE